MNFQDIWSQVSAWLIGNVAWEAVLLLFAVMLAIRKTLLITYQLLHENRFAYGRGHGKRLADWFITIWTSKHACQLVTRERYKDSVMTSRHDKVWMANKLEKMGLVEVRNNTVYPINKLRNRLVLKLCVYWLVLIVGDSMNHYKQLGIDKKPSK